MSNDETAAGRSPWLVFGVTALGTFMATLDSSIVNVALPVISNTLQVSLTLAQWVVTAYLLAISSLLPVFGRAGDLYGTRRVYSTGFLVFAASSAFCGATNQIGLLIGARILQALGAAMLMANSSAIVTRAFPPGRRGRALGSVGTVVALGSMVGPSLGGILTGAFGWQAIFYVNIPIGIAGFIAAAYLLPPGEKKRDETFDWPGAVSFSAGIGGFLLVLSHGQEWGWNSPASLGLAAFSLLGFALFTRVERRVPYPMLDFALFHNWPFFAGNLAGLLSFMAMFSNTILLPFFLTGLLGLSPLQTGLLITPFPLAMAAVAPFSGSLSDRISPVLLTTVGLGITAVGLGFLATTAVDTPLWHIVLAQGLLGFGNGMFQSPNNNSVLSSVDKAKIGIASGVNALVRNVGMVVGTAVAVTILESRRRSLLAGLVAPTADQLNQAFLGGYHAALLVGAGFAVVAALISLNRRGHVLGRGK